VRFDQAALEATLAHYLGEVDHIAERIGKLEQAIDEAVKQATPEIRAVIEALQALRGVAQTTAATVVSELGSLSRFPSPSQLMGYSGLVSSEHTSGNRVHRGAITKTGNAHVQGRVLRRQKSLALSDEAKRIAWKAQQRLHKRFTALAARGKEKNVIVTALARELLGFLWAIAVHAEAQFKMQKK
jgi:transposase